MFQLSHNEDSRIVTATTTGDYDASIAMEQMHQILGIPNLPDKIRVLRVFSSATFRLTPSDLKEHFSYVQQQLNKTHIKKCYLAMVTDIPLNTALGLLYQSNQTAGSCHYLAKAFSTEEAATQWLMEK